MIVVKYMFLTLLLLSVNSLCVIGVIAYQRVRRNVDFWKDGNELSHLAIPTVISVVVAFVSAVGCVICFLLGWL